MALIELHGWVDKQLSSVLNFPVPEDLIRYILAIENTRDLEDYLKTLLDFNNPQHSKFFSDLLDRRQQALNGNVLDVHGYKKPPVEKDYIFPKHEKKKKSKIVSEDEVAFQSTVENAQSKKKQKYVNLYSQEGRDKDVVLLKGRHVCECQASKHHLINNCLKCGRIVCEQEGSGPCLFCGALVCSPEEQEVLNSKTKKAEKLYQKLVVDSKEPQNWEKALQHRDRLLEYDRTSERRTKVIDDESDYFAANSVWLTKEEREKLQQKEAEMRAKKHASQRNKKITLDFAGRQVIEEKENFDMYEDMNELLQSSGANINVDMDDRSEFPDVLSTLSMFQDSSFSLDEDTLKNHMVGMTPDRNCYRIQDREYLEMSDEGFCLSMHQPWASLLVSGIKRHEGRVWYTPHRGRLWIAAGSKVPNPQSIEDTENTYRLLLSDDIKFPTSYPVGCLLGCVNLVDCLPQEVYREKFRDGESESPFVFLCQEPKELPLKFPIQGKHKIYKLDPKIHEAAKNLLMRAARQKAQNQKSSH